MRHRNDPESLAPLDVLGKKEVMERRALRESGQETKHTFTNEGGKETK